MKTETAVILLIAAMFVGGIIIGAVGHKTLTEKPARPGLLPYKNHVASSMTQIPVPDDCLRRWKAGETVHLKGGCFGMEKALAESVAVPNTKEAQKDPATIGIHTAPIGNPYTLDPQTREWYRLMAEKGFYPMVIMVPKKARRDDP